MAQTTRLLIAGEQVDGTGAALPVENPATEAIIATVGSAGPEQIAAATRAASEAQAAWQGIAAAERAELLHEIARGLREQTDALAAIMTARAASR